jgi:Na+/pantothenate symporter
MGRPDRNTGFKAPSGRRLGREHRTAALAELVASIVLALCTVIAVTAVTVGIARADVVGNVIDHETSLFAVALMLGLVFIVIGGVSALPHWPRKSRRG